MDQTYFETHKKYIKMFEKRQNPLKLFGLLNKFDLIVPGNALKLNFMQINTRLAHLNFSQDTNICWG